MPESTRRQFLGAAAALSALAGRAGAASGDGSADGPATDSDATQDQLRADLVVSADHGPLWLERYPEALDGPDWPRARVSVRTDPLWGSIYLGAKTARDGDSYRALLDLEPDEAEQLAALLEEFAAKCREGERWVYP